MAAGGIIVLASGSLLAAAWIVSRFIAGVLTYAETQCALPDAWGDVVELPREAAAGSNLYRAGGRAGTQPATIQATSVTHCDPVDNS